MALRVGRPSASALCTVFFCPFCLVALGISNSYRLGSSSVSTRSPLPPPSSIRGYSALRLLDLSFLCVALLVWCVQGLMKNLFRMPGADKFKTEKAHNDQE